MGVLVVVKEGEETPGSSAQNLSNCGTIFGCRHPCDLISNVTDTCDGLLP